MILEKNVVESFARTFKTLHQGSEIFVLPNCWDAGSAKIISSFGFKALATTSAGLAYTLGKADGNISLTRDETLKNVESILRVTHLPLSVDLENGYGDTPFDCAQTIKSVISLGAAGGSIEDATGKVSEPIYPFEQALERVKASVEAAREAPYSFTLTARAENFINGRYDLKDTIKRLIAFADAGADVVFAPGLRTKEDIETVVKAVAPCPVNVLMASSNGITIETLQEIGVKRVSLGSSLIRAAYGELFRALEEIKSKGTFQYTDQTVSYSRLNDIFSGK